MKSTSLLIAAIILAALSGLLYWSNHRKPAEDTTKASSDAPPKILSFDESDVTSLDLKHKDAPEIALSKQNNEWKITEPKALGADQQSVSSVLSTLSTLTADRLIEDKTTNLAPYGLTAPALELDITSKNNKTQKLLIGDATPTGSASYAALAGDPRVFTIPSYSKSSIDKNLADLRDKRLLTLDLDKLSQIEITAKNKSITFGRNKDEWQILKPKPVRADNSKVEDLVRNLREARMDLVGGTIDEKAATEGFNSGAPFASVRVTGPTGSQDLTVRKKKDDYYAKSSAVEGAYKIGSSSVTGLDKPLDDFRNKKLFSFGFEDPNKIEIHDGAKSYFFTRSGEDWWGSEGKKLDADTVRPVIDKLRDLAATKFPESGFTAPALSVTVTSSDGKRSESASFAKSGDAFVARRADDPSLYQLDAKSISDVQKAAADVKPAPPPPPPAKK
jgi:Domain of unknown function (DUF4340)